MKKYFILLFGMLSLFACQEDELTIYKAVNYLDFVQNSKKDSLTLSFFFHPGKEEIQIPLELALTGDILKEDKEFKLSIDESSTATEDDVIFPEKFVFKANKTVDTLYFSLKKSQKLESDTCKLVLRIEDNINFKRGIKEYSLRKIYFTSVVSKPLWWDEDIENFYLGEFTPVKYNLFCKVTGKNDLTDVNPSLIRQYALTFKRYLIENPSYDGDKLIEIPVIG